MNQLPKVAAPLILVVYCMITNGCMSVQTRKGIVAEQVQMHPEFDNMMETLRRIETKCDDSVNKLAGSIDVQVESTDRITETIKKLEAEVVRLRTELANRK